MSLPASTDRWKSLANLPHDLLTAICDLLDVKLVFPITTVARFERHTEEGFRCLPKHKATLIALSMTCKLLRQICSPYIFRASVLDVELESACLPAPVILYTRRLYIACVQMDAQQFRVAVESLSQLREAYVNQSGIFIPALLEQPTLQVLSVRDAHKAIVAPLGTIAAPLRVLRMYFPRRLRPPPRSRDDIPHEKRWLRTVLHHVRHTLEELFIPGESTDVAFLASQSWPCLRELVIFGECPDLNVSLLDLLCMLPQLRAFTFAPVHVSDRRPVLIWPPKPQSTAYPDITGLQRISISSPSEDDDIFIHLPTELRELALRDTPRFYRRHRVPPGGASGTTFFSGILSCSSALRIFHKLHAPSLVRLELVVMEDPRELEMLSYIAASCPKLASLELHRYRDAADWHAVDNAPPTISLTRLAAALAEFKALRTLRLNFDFPEAELQIEGFYPSFDHALQLIERAARTVAAHLPWLDTICMLGWRGSPTVRGWIMWAVRERDGVLTLDNLDLYWLDM